MNSFSRFLGLEPLASERGVASVGDPVNRGERLGDSAVPFRATIKGKNSQFSLNFPGSFAFHDTFCWKTVSLARELIFIFFYLGNYLEG